MTEAVPRYGVPRVKLPDPVPYLERWARWSVSGDVVTLRYSGATMFGRLAAGKRWLTCPLCDGAKRIPGKLVGVSHPVIVCPRCNGDGELLETLATDGSPSVKACKTCARTDANGNVRSWGEIDGRTCHKCYGSGVRVETFRAVRYGDKVKLESCRRVHPATIPGTRRYGTNVDPDPISALLDRLIAGWEHSNLTHWLYVVIIAEYRSEYLGKVVVGTQQDKAEAMRTSRRWFVKNLTTAHQRVSEALKTAI